MNSVSEVILNRSEVLELLKPMVKGKVIDAYFEGLDYSYHKAKVVYKDGFVHLYIGECLITKRPDFDNSINYII